MDIKTSNLPQVIETKSGRYIIFSENEHISQYLMENGAWEEHTFQILCALMDKRKGDFVDIGANMGALSIPLARVYPSRNFYCFEAQRQVYQQLCGNAVLNATANIFPYHMAIGNPQSQNESIKVPVPDYVSDLNIGAVTLDKRLDQPYDKFETVSLLKADELGLNNVAVIKIDVEGMELDVMKGMKETLIRNNYPYIIFEIWRDGTHAWVQEERAEIEAFLNDLGYRVDIFQNVNMGLAQHKTAPQIELAVKNSPRS